EPPAPVPKPPSQPAARAASKPEPKPAETAPPARAEVAKASAPKPAAKDSLPSLTVEKTLWHPVAEKRVAVIALPGHDPQEFHEGAEVVPGTRIASIEPSGVVFRCDGRDIRRQVGEGAGSE